MVRLARPQPAWSDDDDEFPEIDALVSKKLQQKKTNSIQSKPEVSVQQPAKPPSTVRRRKLGPLTDNLLLRAWTPDSAEDDGDERLSLETAPKTRPQRAKVHLRTRNTKFATVIPSSPADGNEEYVSAKEEVTVIEEVSVLDDTFHSCDSDDSDFEIHEDEENGEDFGDDFIFGRPPAKPSSRAKIRKALGRNDEVGVGRHETKSEEEAEWEPRRTLAREPPMGQVPSSTAARAPGGKTRTGKGGKDLADTMSRLRLDETEGQTPHAKPSKRSDRGVTPPSTPPKSRPGLVSPRKLPRIPITPHRPSSDMFWSQEFVDDWNEEHSPRKQLFPDAVAAKQKSPVKNSLEKKVPKSTDVKKPSDRGAKKAFENTKHDLAEKFLQELDEAITDGKLAELAASTGGIKVIWTNKLNTTAGRANWKRETIRTRAPNSTTTTTTSIKHHASIELAEKVIDSPHRLLNVLAHEFCHLANFMVSGITTNPHGREFKAWASRVTQAFGESRGIEVTTKHSYDIDFKYVWQCIACSTEFKRHSRSIDPARHRCGSCRSELRQTKPVPRKKKEEGAGGDAPGRVSEYQAFLKKQMRVVKAENPKSPQKEIMRIVASRWAAKKDRAKAATPEEGVQGVVEGLEELVV